MYSKKERHELITEKVITSVYANHLKYGDKLPSENQLSNALDVPRASIREVYNALDIFGIVESRRGEGTFLKSGDGGNEMIFKIMMLALYNDNTDVYEIMEIRKIIETGIAEKAAQFRSDEDVRQLRKCIKEMKNCNDGNRLSELDNILHSTIGKACGNPLLSNLSEIISSLTISSIKEHWNYITFDKNKDSRQQTYEQHKELVDAIINRKPNLAKMLMEEHLDFVCTSLERYKKRFAEYETEIKTRARVAEMSGQVADAEHKRN